MSDIVRQGEILPLTKATEVFAAESQLSVREETCHACSTSVLPTLQVTVTAVLCLRATMGEA